MRATAAVNGVRLHYLVEGEGPLVVLLHGWPQTWYCWRKVVGPLAAAGRIRRHGTDTEANHAHRERWPLRLRRKHAPDRALAVIVGQRLRSDRAERLPAMDGGAVK